MAIRIDIRVGDAETFQGFERVQDSLKAIRGAFKDVHASTRAGNPALRTSAALFERADKAADGYATSLRKVAMHLSMIRAVGFGLPALPKGGGSSTPGRSPVARSARSLAPPILDPAQAMQNAQARLSANPNDPAALRQFNAANRQANRSKNRPDPVMQAVLRSRYVQQGGRMVGMPLGIDIMKLTQSGNGAALSNILNGGLQAGGGAAGAAAAAGPLIVALAAAAAAVVSFKTAVDSGTQALRVRSRIGGTFGEAGTAASYARAIGLSPDAAAELSANIRGGGTAGAAAARAGISPVRGPYGDMNDAKAFIRAIDLIARSKNFDQARRTAAEFGMPDLAQAYYLDGKTRQQLANGGPQMTDSDSRAIANFNAQLTILTRNFEGLARVVALPALAVVNIGLSSLNTALAAVTKTISNNWGWIKFFMFGPVGGAAISAAEWMNKQQEDRSKQTKGMENAINENTRAVNANTRTIEGGGSRARGAIPQYISGENMKPAMDRIELGLI